ncbi:hypothetical protein JTZ62_05070 [Mammaliicoccus sciuri]|uniref:PQ-loop domain-containing transporter n=1 Tax=Mammaliicoccus sciuri TaxID=1296 RepID=UPI0019D3DC88|nr:PQ-loop domain-containing transporter [Mammaliicoccus sciuri]QSN68531.1 hypothetical protein JTZ62_05070 [Mammaliicoccus sciuri]UIU23273.1 hypothetical protein LLZ87_05085 [Mammaliicoccus sciuri]UIU26179.1 hypothetical protein LLZ92_05085 [Mammaliicoccus sciuri]
MILLLLNIAVVIILTHAYVPQLRTTYKTRTAEGVSPLFWLLISLSTSYSLFNILATGQADWFTYLGQFINATVAFILFVWITKLKYRWEVTLFVTLLYVFMNLYVHNVVTLELSQSIATIAIIAAYFDQILHFIKNKNAVGTNPLLYLYFALGLILLTIIMFMTSVTIYVIVTELVNITLLLICGALSKKYQQNNL